VRGPLAALEFLTRLRLTGGSAATLDEIAKAQAWFPVVGLVIGAVLLAADRAAMRALPAASVDVLLVVTWAAVTGALHLDGLADAADGLFGGDTPARRLEIMRDVHAGTFAIVAIASVLALKWAGLAALPSSVRIEALLLAPCLARATIPLSFAIFPYARSAGMGAAFATHARMAAPPAAALAVVACVVLLGGGGVGVAAWCAVSALVVGLYARRLLDGITGDVAGATVEIAEASTLLFIAALANRGWLDAWLLG
jgi:adenosylcobinamide-GDP ribazoletransferase